MSSPSESPGSRNPGPNRLAHRQHEDQRHDAAVRRTQAQQGSQAVTLEFKAAEEMIRHDAAAVELPPGIAERLRASIAKEPGRPIQKRWWQRLLGGS